METPHAVKRKMTHIFLVLMVLITASVFFSCDTSKKNHPYLIINVTLAAPEVPGPGNQLYIVFHFLPDWSTPWLTLSSETNTILVPPLNVSTLPLYFEIIYDFTGDGNPGSGDWYHGWNGIIDRTTPVPLDAFIIPDVPLMVLNIAMDQPTVNYEIIP